MRTIYFDPEQLTEPGLKEWWKQWQVEARQAAENGIEAWEQWLATWKQWQVEARQAAENGIEAREQWLAMNPRPKEFSCAFQQAVWAKLKAWLLESLNRRSRCI